MNARRGLDPRPRVRERGGERRPQRLVGQRQAVLDVRREVRRAGRRDDVALQRRAGAQLDRRAGEHRRAHPLVEVQLVAGVEEDPEERVAEVAVDDLLQRPADLADVQRAVPLGHRLEVRRDEPLDVVGDPVGELGRILGDEAGAAVEARPRSRTPPSAGRRARSAGRPG